MPLSYLLEDFVGDDEKPYERGWQVPLRPAHSTSPLSLFLRWSASRGKGNLHRRNDGTSRTLSAAIFPKLQSSLLAQSELLEPVLEDFIERLPIVLERLLRRKRAIVERQFVERTGEVPGAVEVARAVDA